MFWCKRKKNYLEMEKLYLKTEQQFDKLLVMHKKEIRENKELRCKIKELQTWKHFNQSK